MKKPKLVSISVENAENSIRPNTVGVDMKRKSAALRLSSTATSASSKRNTGNEWVVVLAKCETLFLSPFLKLLSSSRRLNHSRDKHESPLLLFI